MKFGLNKMVLLCVLAAATTAAHAQTQSPTKRIEPPARFGAPGRGVGGTQPLTSESMSPILTRPNPSIQVQPRALNLDAALARLFASLKAVAATGDFELSVTNAGKVEITVLPLTLYSMEGRIRTELDLGNIPARIDSTGPFTAFRAAGINRIITLTLGALNLRLTQQLFPDAKGYITQSLPDEDIPALIRLEQRPLGKDPATGLEKLVVTFTYPNGDKREARLWQSAGDTPHPAQVQFDVGDTLITVRFKTLEMLGADAVARVTALFQVPSDYTKFSEVGSMLQIHSARQTKAFR